MNVDFQKWQHMDNSFVIIQEKEGFACDARAARAMCERHKTDGLLVYQISLAPRPEARARAFFNNDGSRADYCGNAHICLATLATHKNIADVVFNNYRIHTTNNEKTGPVLALSPFDWEKTPVDPLDFGALERDEFQNIGQNAYTANFGVPHLVVFDPPVTEDDIVNYKFISRDTLNALSAHAAFENGVNVTFVFCRDRARGVWASRTFERGCQRFTDCCFSGIAAALLVALKTDRLSPVAEAPLTWHSGPHSVKLQPTREHLRILSQAQRVCQGSQDIQTLFD